MDFAKKTYKVQTIVFIIMMIAFFLLAVLGVAGIIKSILEPAKEGWEGLGTALLLVLSLIAIIAGIVLGCVLIVKLVVTKKLLTALKVSKADFVEKKGLRVTNLVFTILIVVAGIISVVANQEIALKIISGVIALVILLFEILDSIALKKVLKENEIVVVEDPLSTTIEENKE